MKQFGTVGVVGRWKPLHNGGVLMLETILQRAEHVKIGIGSCNKYNLRNPFTADESREMIDAFLSPKYNNYSFLYIPDYAHIPKYRDGKRWVEEVRRQYGSLDAFVSGDDYVTKLLEPHYTVIHPGDLIPEESWTMIRGAMVRVEMAKGGDAWKLYVPEPVATYLDKNGIVHRFRREFGLLTLTLLQQDGTINMPEDVEQEKNHTTEV